jgi:hypothetical protein
MKTKADSMKLNVIKIYSDGDFKVPNSITIGYDSYIVTTNVEETLSQLLIETTQSIDPTNYRTEYLPDLIAYFFKLTGPMSSGVALSGNHSIESKEVEVKSHQEITDAIKLVSQFI